MRDQAWSANWDGKDLVDLQNLAVAAYSRSVASLDLPYHVDDAPRMRDGVALVELHQAVPGSFPEVVLQKFESVSGLKIDGMYVFLDDDVFIFQVERSFKTLELAEFMALSDSDIAKMAVADCAKLDGIFFNYKEKLLEAVQASSSLSPEIVEQVDRAGGWAGKFWGSRS